MSAPTFYKSSDAGAPGLTGQAGSLLTLLDTLLIGNGIAYGAKNAAGWSKPIANVANVGHYKSATSVANVLAGAGLFASINDAALNATSGAREAQLRGFETMSSPSAGTGPFPTVAQQAASGLVIRKSLTADATAVPWKVLADDRTAYLFIKSPDFVGYGAYMFGEYFSFAADPFRWLVVGRIQTAAGQLMALDSSDNMQLLNGASASPAATVGHYCPRNVKGDIQSAVNVGKHGDAVKGASIEAATPGVIGNGIVIYPNQSDQASEVSPVYLHDVLGLMGLRGRMRGFWQWLHPASVPTDGVTFPGSGAYAGKTFEFVGPIARGDGWYVVETSATWETN